uniref:Uncharacterized protein n=1 Tax=Leptospira santarosai serovar Arenal str. MAVJ 401 TaxID=1049976 RepID=M6JWQ6_9LEPT|nr:hypothetical protein LEP1GSC063_2089 [Leptospira santarosai serovar Arenal str. MAVJ 401]
MGFSFGDWSQNGDFMQRFNFKIVVFGFYRGFLMINMRKKIYCSSWGRHIRSTLKSKRNKMGYRIPNLNNVRNLE